MTGPVLTISAEEQMKGAGDGGGGGRLRQFGFSLSSDTYCVALDKTLNLSLSTSFLKSERLINHESSLLFPQF